MTIWRSFWLLFTFTVVYFPICHFVFWCERWDSNPQNSVFETDTYTYSVTLAQYCLIKPMITSDTAPIIIALYVITPVLLNSISAIHISPTHVTQKHPLSSHSFIIYPQKLVGVLGFEPSQEHSSSAKGIIRPSRVPTPTPLFGAPAQIRTEDRTVMSRQH